MGNRRDYWEGIYLSNKNRLPGWFQEIPTHSIKLIKSCNLEYDSKIIDIGGGDSFLVDHLLKKEYQNVSVLDISKTSIERAQNRLGDKAKLVNWIAQDITELNSDENYELWHDRAAFHFLLTDEDIKAYLNSVINSLVSGGWFILGTFSDQGPKKCSGLPITQYSVEKLTSLFGEYFQLIEWFYDDHYTPGGGIQNYIYCRFMRK